MRHRRIWKLGILAVALIGAFLLHSRSPTQPTLRIVNPEATPANGRILVELRNDTSQSWGCHRGNGQWYDGPDDQSVLEPGQSRVFYLLSSDAPEENQFGMLVPGLFHVFHVPADGGENGTTYTLHVNRLPNRFAKWSQALARWIPRLGSVGNADPIALTVRVAPHLDAETFLQETHAAEKPFEGRMNLRTHELYPISDYPPAALFPPAPAKSP